MKNYSSESYISFAKSDFQIYFVASKNCFDINYFHEKMKKEKFVNEQIEYKWINRNNEKVRGRNTNVKSNYFPGEKNEDKK